MSTSAASTSNEDELRNQVLWDLDDDAETAPADAALLEALTDSERRAVYSFMRLLRLSPLPNQGPDHFLFVCRELVEFLHQQASR